MFDCVKKYTKYKLKISNKLLLLCLIIVVIPKTLYTIDLSIGFSFGAGAPVMYGEDFDSYKKYYENNYQYLKLYGYTLLIPQIDLMLECSPFFAIELGLGYKLSTYKVKYEIHDDADEYSSAYSYDYIISHTKNYIYIPLMLRGQYQYSLGVIYLSTGVKFGFPVGSTYTTSFCEYTEGDFIGYFYYSGDVRPSLFLLDVSFAIGHEFNVATSHYVGIKVNYDLAVIKPFYAMEGTTVKFYGKSYPFADDAEWKHDDITFAITYRYAL